MNLEKKYHQVKSAASSPSSEEEQSTGWRVEDCRKQDFVKQLKLMIVMVVLQIYHQNLGKLSGSQKTDLTEPVVFSQHPEFCEPDKDPEAEEGLEEVVGNHDLLDVVGLPVLHEGGPCYPDYVPVAAAEGQHRPGGGHEQPGINPEQWECQQGPLHDWNKRWKQSLAKRNKGILQENIN